MRAHIQNRGSTPCDVQCHNDLAIGRQHVLPLCLPRNVVEPYITYSPCRTLKRIVNWPLGRTACCGHKYVVITAPLLQARSLARRLFAHRKRGRTHTPLVLVPDREWECLRTVSHQHWELVPLCAVRAGRVLRSIVPLIVEIPNRICGMTLCAPVHRDRVRSGEADRELVGTRNWTGERLDSLLLLISELFK